MKQIITNLLMFLFTLTICGQTINDSNYVKIVKLKPYTTLTSDYGEHTIVNTNIYGLLNKDTIYMFGIPFIIKHRFSNTVEIIDSIKTDNTAIASYEYALNYINKYNKDLEAFSITKPVLIKNWYFSDDKSAEFNFYNPTNKTISNIYINLNIFDKTGKIIANKTVTLNKIIKSKNVVNCNFKHIYNSTKIEYCQINNIKVKYVNGNSVLVNNVRNIICPDSLSDSKLLELYQIQNLKK